MIRRSSQTIHCLGKIRQKLEEIRNQPTGRQVIITRKSQWKDVPTKNRLRVENTEENVHRKLSTNRIDDNKGICQERLQDANGGNTMWLRTIRNQMLVQMPLHARIQGNINFGEIRFDTITTMSLGEMSTDRDENFRLKCKILSPKICQPLQNQYICQ